MLDTATKRRIDTARDILVGKVPDPKSQVEQITIALIYKFMDDMDAGSEELGGKRKFFTGAFARYGWAKLMHSGLGGHETLSLYAEAIAKMPENPGIPLLFREIFKNAYLPYRDPETLRAFLKVIDGFTYDHSERLGDAFEYLLSVLGSQGDAGQFRTPRHIIDFMVDVLDPKKGETVLDPACGTAGFLISSYKHIIKANTDGNGHLEMTSGDKKRLVANFTGYDISPDMVRLSLVNLYLHGFPDPHIYEYDTLSSQDRWNEYADVILANPPFMSPKGGIRPHNRFSVQSKRSEVLFVDYMAEHLTSNGRAGIIVPEGIIFQSQTAYKQLRKTLVEDSLVAVISLPSGVFNPYSGVKTSILILDKSLAKQSATIGFFKIGNDGFGLGAQRREIGKNDIPQARAEIAEYLRRMRTRESIADFTPSLGLVVPKERIAANGEYNLGADRYRESAHRFARYSHVQLGDLVDILDSVRRPVTKHDRKPGPYPYYGATGVLDYVEGYLFDERLVLVGEDGAKWGTGEPSAFPVDGRVWVNNHAHVLRPKRDRLLDRFLIEILNEADLSPYITGVTVPKLNQEKLRSIEIPLPPIEVQQEIVAEIEGYQKVIDGARAVLDNYRPHIPIDPGWPMVELGNVVSYSSGGTPSKANKSYWLGDIPWISAKDMKSDVLSDASTHVSAAAVKETATRIAAVGSLLILVRGMGLANGVPICELAKPCAFNQDVKAMNPHPSVNPTYLRVMLKQEASQFRKILETAAHGTLKINTADLSRIRFPLPSLATQQAVVAEIEAEYVLVAANRDLIARYGSKINATLARVWSEGEHYREAITA